MNESTNTLIISLIMAVLIIALVFGFIFSGNIKKSVLKASKDLFELEEIDPTIWDRGFHAARAGATDDYGDLVTSFVRTANSNEPVCFGMFPVISKGFFMNNYLVKTRKTIDDDGKTATAFSLHQYRDSLPDGDQANIQGWQAVSDITYISNYVPCVVRGERAEKFYEDVIVNKKIDPNYFYGEKISQWSMYIDPDKSKDLDILHITNEGSQNADAPIEFDQGDDIRYYFILKQKEALCIIPTYNDWFDGCDEPKDGLIDDDCLDAADDNKLPRILNNQLKDYVCKDYIPAIEQVAQIE